MFDILQLDLQNCGLREKRQPQKEEIIVFPFVNKEKHRQCFQQIYLWYLRNPTDMPYKNSEIYFVTFSCIITARKRIFGQGNIFTGVCLFTG